MPKSLQEQHRHPEYPRLILQRRRASRFWQAVTFLEGKQIQKSTKAAEFTTALRIAEDWYQKQLRASVESPPLRGPRVPQHPRAAILAETLVGGAFRHYRAELAAKPRAYADQKWGPIAPFWRAVRLDEIRPQTFRDFYTWRRVHGQRGKKISNHTLHKDVILIRQILKYAVEQELITSLPVIPRVGKIAANPRPWLTPAEWEHLRSVAQQRVDTAPNYRLTRQRTDLLDFMTFMIHSMCRVDEALGIRFRDCTKKENAKGETVLLVEVTGKRGTRTIVALHGAARVVSGRGGLDQDPNALVFPEHHRDAFRELLKAAGLYKDAHGFTRNFKSLRATAISFAILRGAPNPNLLMIARNAGTSLAMIDQFYAKRLSAEMHLDALSAGQDALIDGDDSQR